MSDMSSLEAILSSAEGKEKEYDWLGAAESYKNALGLVPEQDSLRMSEVHERLGYALHRFAFQAESNDEFRQRLHQSILSYEKSKELYGRLNESVKMPRMLRCDGLITYLNHWLAVEAGEKKRLLDECWRLTKDALKAFEEVEDALEYGKTYNQLASSAFLAYVLEWNFQVGEKIIREAMELGERAVTLLSSVGDPYELARAYVKAAFYLTTFSLYFVPDLDERERLRQKGQGYLQKAIELSEETALLALAGTPGVTGDETGLSIDDMLVHFEKALGYAKKTKDKYLIGTALDWLTYAAGWKSMLIEDPDKRLEAGQRALQYAEDAKHQFSSISFVSPRGDVLWTEAPHAQLYMQKALFETDSRKKRDLLEKAVIDGAPTIRLAESTGYPGITAHAYQILSVALGRLAEIEPSLEEKKSLLEKAMEHGTKTEKIVEQQYPFLYWNRGFRLFFFANLKAEMSNSEKDSGKKRNMLEEAISDKERALQLCIKESLQFERRGDLSLSTTLAFFQYSYGELLNRLYGLTNSNGYQRKAIKTFEEAAESYQKANLLSRVAECCWKTARGYGALGEHLNAAKNFNLASNNYTSAAEKIPQLKSFYQDHALYMQAWSEIEKARHHHDRQEYGSAKEHFEKAAELHKSLKRWGYLEPNYSAWAQVENGEELSRKEQSEEAIEAFKQAATLFSESKKSLQTQLSKIEDEDERQMATSMIKASDLRQEYCDARIALEEAKILDKKGEHFASSGKYGFAAETFEKIGQNLESEQERKEFKFIINLSRAWQKMMLADAKASPELYLEASALFEQASKESNNEMTGLLALGHSRFCRALEAGTKFADTGDAVLHKVAIQHLESAAKYYVKAGFQSASEYAKATGLLFDAYVHMDNAKREEDPEKKAKLYTIAEKVLQTSAGFYMKAEHPEKREQVMRLLDKVREERELAVSIAEVLHAPTVISTTTSFVAPTPTSEEAVGSERFEHADVQANLIIRQKDLKVGESLDIELELVNAGKGPALLTKVTDIIPNGFELTEKPEAYRVEDSYLNMKGKRLDPLKTEEVKLVLKPTLQGMFSFKPTVLYLDERGKYKSHEPEPVTIVVKELGIKGWLKGER
ncbi:MAG: hypothetical protein ABSF24_10620 [Candidatus Bathyarchaeia archaeon]|jgi:hypothetical protein